MDITNFENYILSEKNISDDGKYIHIILKCLDSDGNILNTISFVGETDKKIKKYETQQIEKTRLKLEKVGVDENGQDLFRQVEEKYFENEIVETESLIKNLNYLSADAEEKEILAFVKTRRPFNGQTQ